MGGDTMEMNYQMRVFPYQNGNTLDWVVDYPDLPGCSGAGDSIEEAIEEAEINKELWLEATIKAGKELPIPSTSFSEEYSGKFNLRIPKSLHRELALQAEADGVSLNALCATFLAKCICNTNSGDAVKDTIAASIILTPNQKIMDNATSWKRNPTDARNKVIPIQYAS